jgi:hypothetical protein
MCRERCTFSPRDPKQPVLLELLGHLILLCDSVHNSIVPRKVQEKVPEKVNELSRCSCQLAQSAVDNRFIESRVRYSYSTRLPNHLYPISSYALGRLPKRRHIVRVHAIPTALSMILGFSFPLESSKDRNSRKTWARTTLKRGRPAPFA